MRKRTMFKTGDPSRTFEVAAVGLCLPRQWTYYFNEWHPKGEDIHFAFVDGDFAEMGDVSLSELSQFPFVVSSPWNSPPIYGWEWAPYDDDFNEEIDD